MRKIKGTIDGHKYFDSGNFKFSEKQEYNGSSLLISFISEPKYFFKFELPNQANSSGNYDITGSVCPGPLSLEEKVSLIKEAKIYDQLLIWLNCIWEELSTNPIIKEINKQRDEIDSILDNLSELPEEYFNQDEVNELSNRLNQFEESFRTEFEKNIKDKKKLEKKIQDLTNDVELLKVTLNSLKKSGWRKNFITKMYKWVKDPENRNLIKDGVNIVKGFLPDGDKLMMQ